MHQFTNKDIQSIKDRVYYLIARARRSAAPLCISSSSGAFLGQFVPALITQHQSDEMMRYLNTHSTIDYYPLAAILQPFIDIARSQLKAEALEDKKQRYRGAGSNPIYDVDGWRRVEL